MEALTTIFVWTTVWIWVLIWALLLYFIVSYNSLVRLANNINNAFADVDVQIKLRFDLLDNLINTVKWYASHEKETLEKLTDARTSFMHASSPQDKIAADGMLAGALKSLFAVSENYPDLKANQNFLQLQTELADIENKIAATRRFFNSAVNEYNSTVQSFPTNILAWLFWFSSREFFATQEAEKVVPKVAF